MKAQKREPLLNFPGFCDPMVLWKHGMVNPIHHMKTPGFFWSPGIGREDFYAKGIISCSRLTCKLSTLQFLPDLLPPAQLTSSGSPRMIVLRLWRWKFKDSKRIPLYGTITSHSEVPSSYVLWKAGISMIIFRHFQTSLTGCQYQLNRLTYCYHRL